MHLTKEEEKILNGEEGYAKQKALEILVALGKTYNADSLIPIKSAHLSGVSYKSLGDAGLEFLEELTKEQIKVSVPTTLNPGGVSPKMNPPKEFVEKQKKIISTYTDLGVVPTLTCTPYYVGNPPKEGDHVAWAESSAVVYANSVLGAYTNREGGPSALAAALIGKTSNYGLHLDKNRKAKISVSYNGKLDTFSDFAALGYYCGQRFKDSIISFNLKFKPNLDNLKGLSAAIAAAGSVPMFKIGDEGENIEILQEEVDTVFNDFNSKKDPDLVCIGCPHASLEQLKEISNFLRGKKINESVTFWIFTSKFIYKISKETVKEIEESGAKVITDTCMVVAPLEELGFACMYTNSAKAAFYSRTLCHINTKLGSLREIVDYSTK